MYKIVALIMIAILIFALIIIIILGGILNFLENKMEGVKK